MSLNCSNNQLEILNVKNGNNLNFVNFDASGNPGLYCVLVDNVSYSNSNWTAKDAQTLYSDTDCKAKLQPKVFLQGAMLNPISGEENLMRDSLRSLGYLPTTSPYEDGLTCDVSVFNVTGDNAIVDWIEVSLRDALNPQNILKTRSALLQRDGDVVDVDGVSEIAFNLWAKAYYISFSHRNHLGMMSNVSSVLNFVPDVFNFSDGSIATYGSNAQTSLGMPNGVFGLWTGDSNISNQIKFSGSNNGSNVIKDFILADPANAFNSTTFSSMGYLNIDINMDGIGKFSGSGNDSNIIKDNVLAHPDNGFNSPTFTIISTVPNN
ncbi:hemagglutinin protein [Formosa maritima]|uniref:Hemagglutinin protein n=1 Tax=Formosa maritima TaxID=2592046 RepID=A0A5D0GCT1_9FLAO|nr:hemagglutinin protein [Formosa maritima]